MQQGAMGAAIGGFLAPVLGWGGRKALEALKGSDVGAIASRLGISKDAAKVIRNALAAGDMDAAESALKRAGADAMLADAGQPARGLLDAAAQSGGAAGRIVSDAVETRVESAGRSMNGTLDDVLGPPQSPGQVMSAIRQGSAPTRSAAYQAAYNAAIDYSSDAGRQIEALISRVPGSVVRRANQMMSAEGLHSGQLMASIADDGTVTFQTLPDVRQIDYITRALRDAAESLDGTGKLGGTTNLGRIYGNLSRDLRDAVKTVVPEYGQALSVASDAIAQVEASKLGTTLLSPRTNLHDAAQMLVQLTPDQRQAAKISLRGYIDNVLAHVKRTVADPNTDAREVSKLVGELSSRGSRQKLELLLGKADAKALFDEMAKAGSALELRAATAQNSKTAVRQAIQGTVKEMTEPGALTTLQAGEPVAALKRLTQALTGADGELQALQQAGIMEDIARALTEQRGESAKAALRYIRRAIEGQPLNEAQAKLVSHVVASTGVLTGNRNFQQIQAIQ